MSNSFEKEETGQKVNLDQHYRMGCDHIKEDDDVYNPKCIEDHVSWTSQ